MADLVVPQLGESITEAVISRWLKQVGDSVAVDESVAELETDKITVQLPSPVAGALTEQRFAVGATVKVGDVIGAVEAGKVGKAPAKTDGVPRPAPAAPAPAAEVQTASPQPYQPPQLPPNMRAAGVQIATPPSPSKGNGESTDLSAQVLRVAPPPGAPRSSGPSLDRDTLLKLTPSQRVTARETGTLPGRSTGQAAPQASGPSADERLAHVDPRDEVVAMSPLRKRVAERLVQAQHEAASLTTFNEVDMTAVIDLRTRYKDSFEKTHGVKLGFMSFFVKACVAAC
jgi:2-oxoglutarate dehydrogenase E2 component (dihydrolipoamide succinyltransferase)